MLIACMICMICMIFCMHGLQHWAGEVGRTDMGAWLDRGWAQPVGPPPPRHLRPRGPRRRLAHVHRGVGAEQGRLLHRRRAGLHVPQGGLVRGGPVQRAWGARARLGLPLWGARVPWPGFLQAWTGLPHCRFGPVGRARGDGLWLPLLHPRAEPGRHGKITCLGLGPCAVCLPCASPLRPWAACAHVVGVPPVLEGCSENDMLVTTLAATLTSHHFHRVPCWPTPHTRAATTTFNFHPPHPPHPHTHTLDSLQLSIRGVPGASHITLYFVLLPSHTHHHHYQSEQPN
jgi:hypothetical protein